MKIGRRRSPPVGEYVKMCDIPHDSRCARHKRVMRRIEQLLQRKGTKVWMQPIIPSATSFIKPDLIIQEEQTLHIMEVSIASAHKMWELKIKKYDSMSNWEAIREWRNDGKAI